MIRLLLLLLSVAATTLAFAQPIPVSHYSFDASSLQAEGSNLYSPALSTEATIAFGDGYLQGADSALVTNAGNVFVPTPQPFITGDFSVSMYINFEASQRGNLQFLLDNRLSAGFGDGYILYYKKAEQELVFGAGSNDVRTSVAFTPNTWYHITVTQNSTTGIRAIYIDGQPMSITARGPFAAPNTTSVTYLGNSLAQNRTSARPNGRIDDIKIFDRPLTATEVTALQSRDAVAPAIPTEVELAFIDQRAATLSWTASTDNSGVAYYDIELNTGLSYRAFSSPFLLEALAPGRDYTVKVKAVDYQGNESAFTTPVAFKTILTTQFQRLNPAYNYSFGSLGPNRWTNSTADRLMSEGQPVPSEGADGTTNGGVKTSLGQLKGDYKILNQNSYTISFWTKFEGAPFNRTVAFLDTRSSLNGNPGVLIRYDSQSKLMQFYTTPGTAQANFNPNQDQWYHIAFTVDGSRRQVRIYIDGVFAAAGGQFVDYNPRHANDFTIGTTNVGNNKYLYRPNGLMDEFKVYNSVLNASQVGLVADITAPSDVANLTALNPSASTIDLNWDAATDNRSVAYYQVTLGDTVFNTPSTTFQADWLTANTNYDLRVVAVDASLNYSNLAARTTFSTNNTVIDNVAPTAPVVTSVENTLGISVDVDFTGSTDNIGVTEYRARLVGQPEFSLGLANTVTFSGLTENTAYSFEIYALDAAGNESVRATGNFTTPDVTAPSVVGNLTASNITTSGFTLSYTAASDNVGVQEYLFGAPGAVPSSNGTALGINYFGLDDATVYQVAVYARDAAGNTSAPVMISVTTLDGTPPSTPVNLRTTFVSGTLYDFQFMPSNDNVGVTEYMVTVSGQAPFSNSIRTAGSLTMLDDITTYTLSVVALDAAGNQSAPATTTFTTPDNTAPDVPSNVRLVNATATSLEIAFDASADNVATTDYRVEVAGRQPVAVGNVTQYTVTGLDPSTSYDIAVRALDAAGNASAYSPALTASTTAPPPLAPATNLRTGAVSTTSVTLMFSLSQSHANDYDYIKSVDGVAVETTQFQAANSVLTDFTGLQPNTTYRLGIQVRNQAGELSTIATIDVTTSRIPDVSAPTMPGDLAVTNVSGSRIDFSYTAATDDRAVTEYFAKLDNGAAVSLSTSLVGFFSGLNDATPYTIKVWAVDAAGNASDTASVQATTLDITAPTQPGNFRASDITTSSWRVNFDASSDNVAVVEYFFNVNGLGARSNGTSLTYTFTDANANTTYNVIVYAVDAAGNQSSAASLDVTTLMSSSTRNTPQIAGFGVSPNPITSLERVQLSGVGANDRVELYNLQGQLMQRAVGGEFVLNELASGLYLLRVISSEGAVASAQLVVE